MKFGVTVDCTPEEARAFLGLPDLRPMQEAVLGQMQKQVMDGLSAMTPEAILRAWMPMVPQSPEQMREAFGAMLRMFVPGPPADPNGRS